MRDNISTASPTRATHLGRLGLLDLPQFEHASCAGAPGLEVGLLAPGLLALSVGDGGDGVVQAHLQAQPLVLVVRADRGERLLAPVSRVKSSQDKSGQVKSSQVKSN